LDNVTHSLAGLLLAECALAFRRSRRDGKEDALRRPALLAGVVGNNLPDLDFLYAGITGRPLGYLLHHRGHTHTVPIAFALGWVTFGLAALMRRQTPWGRREMAWLAALSMAGPFVHIAMDFSNNYGVHPFWPLYDDWLYGDSVFILEPFFWVFAVPPLLFAARTRLTQIGLALVLFASIIAAFVLPFVPLGSALALTAAALLMAFATFRAPPTVRMTLGIGVWWGLTALFFTASARAKALLREAAASPDFVVYDIVVTPAPANPLCFEAWVVGTRGGDYVARRAVVALFPPLLANDRCLAGAAPSPTAPLVFEGISSVNSPVNWKGAFVAPLAELAELAAHNCQAAAFLRFARVPYWIRSGEGHIVGDLRYDRNPGLDFADVRIDGPEGRCPHAVPPWVPPRQDLLTAAPRPEVAR
jgi:inner membrane protein